MSTTAQFEETDCIECDQPYTHGYNAEYCSKRCFYRAKGKKALKNLQTDHCICSSCFSQLKQTSGPSEDWKHSRGSQFEVSIQHGGELIQTEDGMSLDLTDASDVRRTDVDSIIGFEHHTPNSTKGVDEKESDRYNIQYERVSCGNCGTVNPNDDPHEFLREIDTAKLLVRVLKRMREKYTEGRIPEKISKQAFFDAYKESDGDLPYAVGRGIYG